MTKIKNLSIIVLFLLIIIQNSFGDTIDWSWVKSSKGKTTNTVLWDLKKTKFFESELPIFKIDFGMKSKNIKSRLSYALREVLGGPSDMVKSPSQNAIILTGCRQHSCDEKGFFWANAIKKASVIGIVHYTFEGVFVDKPQLFLASKNYNCKSFPKEVLAHIKLWIKSKKVILRKTRCLQDGKIIEVKITSL